jgi:hypothetical protein
LIDERKITMKISHKRKMIALAAGTALAALVASGCAASQGSPPDTSSEGSDNVQKVLIGIRQDLYPTSYIDESGKPSGYDIEIIQKVDELLPGYEFEYEAVSQEALLTGLDTGKYAAAVAGFYHTPTGRRNIFSRRNASAETSSASGSVRRMRRSPTLRRCMSPERSSSRSRPRPGCTASLWITTRIILKSR